MPTMRNLVTKRVVSTARVSRPMYKTVDVGNIHPAEELAVSGHFERKAQTVNIAPLSTSTFSEGYTRRWKNRHMYGRGYSPQQQMSYFRQGMMPGSGQAFNPQQMQQQQLPQQQQQLPQNNQGKQHQQPPIPLPPGPPPPSQSTSQHDSQLQQNLQYQSPFVYNSFPPYGSWNGAQNDVSQFNGQIRLNLQNKQTASVVVTGKPELPPLPPTQKELTSPVVPPPSIEKIAEPTLPLSASSIAPPAIGKPTTSTPAIASAPNPVGEWPDNLKNYVKRCYEKCKTAIDKNQVEIILKGKITLATNDGSVWVKDWDKELLPGVHSERMAMTIKSQNSPSELTLAGSGQGGLRKHGLSTSLASGLGTHLSAGHRTSKTRSRSNSRSRSLSRSHSPTSRESRRSTSSSSNTSNLNHDHISTETKKTSSRSNKPNNDVAKETKQAKQTKSDFCSAFGLATGNNDELGSKEKLQQPAARFHDVTSPSGNRSAWDDSNSDFDFPGLHISGTCEDIEKPYLPLTSVQTAMEPLKMSATGPILVFFGVETSSFEENAEILQIYMKCGEAQFNRYVTPLKEISEEMSKINHLTLRESKLYRDGVEKRTAPIRHVLKALLEFLKGFKQPVTLIAHRYCFKNSQRLVRAMKKEVFENKFKNVIAGFTDTMELFGKQFPDIDLLKLNIDLIAKKKSVKLEKSSVTGRSIKRETDLLERLALDSFEAAELNAMKPYCQEVEKVKKRERLATVPVIQKKKPHLESSRISKRERRPF